MIQKIVKKTELKKNDSVPDDLKFWLDKSPEERVSAVGCLRRQRDLADLEALGEE